VRVPQPIRSLARTLGLSGWIQIYREREFERWFAREGQGCFRGVYETFDQARATVPPSKPVGFETAESTEMFADRRTRIYSFDYPMIFWLQKLLHEECTIFDFGGHMGTHFYAYARYLRHPRSMKWMVCELPLVTRAGEDLARKSGADALQFTTNFGDADGADIAIAAGVLQYVEAPSFAARLAGLKHRPPHLLINKLPLRNGPQFVTLQHGLVAFHPMYVFNRGEFIRSLEDLGYELRDEWANETHHGSISFHPERSFEFHSGLYLTLDPQLNSRERRDESQRKKGAECERAAQ
jgi:putative methyltransferase (TIGR04325 family)